MEIKRTHQNDTLAAPRIPVGAAGWTTPARGVRIRGDLPLTHELLVRGAVLASDRVAVACDLTAAHLWSMVVPSGFGLDPDAQPCAIATIRDGTRHRAIGVRGRRLELPSDHVTTLDGIAITTPARTWLDCSPLVRWPDTVAMGDAMLRAALTDRRELERMVMWGRGRRGVRNARRALEILDPRSESPGESWVRAIMREGRVPIPHCNVEVVVAGWTFRLDMAWPEKLVAAEYDGEDHHGPEQSDRDRWRRGLLAEAGWTVLVFRKADLSHPGELVDSVRRALRA